MTDAERETMTVQQLFPNVDAWGAKEWMQRLVDAVRQRDKAVVDKDDVGFEIHKNIASASASRLVHDFGSEILAALEATATPVPGVSEAMPDMCADCGCRQFARVDERKADGSFGPGPQVRCVNCKVVTTFPLEAAVQSPPAGVGVKVLGLNELCTAIAQAFECDDSYGRFRDGYLEIDGKQGLTRLGAFLKEWLPDLALAAPVEAPTLDTAISDETKAALKAIDDGVRAGASSIARNPPILGEAVATEPVAVRQLGGAPDDLRNLIKVVCASMTLEQIGELCREVIARRDPALTSTIRTDLVNDKALADRSPWDLEAALAAPVEAVATEPFGWAWCIDGKWVLEKTPPNPEGEGVHVVPVYATDPTGDSGALREALAEVLGRWSNGYGFNDDSDEDVALHARADAALASGENVP